MAEEYRVRYRLTPDALIDAGRLHQSTLYARYRILTAVIGGVGVVLVIAGYENPGLAITIFGLLLFAMTVTRAFDRWFVARQAKGVIGSTATFVADAEGLHYEHPLGTGVVSWSGINKVRSDERTTVFARDRVIAAYIPAAAFASAADRTAFLDYAAAQVTQAGTGRRDEAAPPG